MFLFLNHQEKFEDFLQRDGTHSQDVERNAMFYIFAGNDELMDKMDVFYDFEHRMIRTEGFGEVGLSSSASALIRLAFNLYNNYPCGTVVELLSNLDEQNLQLAFQAIQLRFNVKGTGGINHSAELGDDFIDESIKLDVAKVEDLKRKINIVIIYGQV